jgi:hypothetical protein
MIFKKTLTWAWLVYPGHGTLPLRRRSLHGVAVLTAALFSFAALPYCYWSFLATGGKGRPLTK